ncbi:glycosyltransferase BC10-like [Prosopis cineraria]|uniref:glycosyltransferase BC10-like n=1 Tax=Prosopis cineraria TaxID=364024 RepID=UPI00240F9EC2|nr:glycosyltransferase BC10-like [Prosopis cineraria]
MEHNHFYQRILKPSNVHFHLNLNHFHHFVFFIVGISLGTVATLYFRAFSFHLQYFLYHVNPAASSQPPYQPPPALASPQPEYGGTSTSNTSSIIRSTTTKVSYLMHNMTDQELFLEAIKVRGTRHDDASSHKTNPKVAFIFLAKGTLPLGPLWERFFKGHEELYNIYLHQHPSFNETVPEDSVFFGRRIPSKPVFWGTSSMIDAERRLLANALLDDISNQRFVLLSESCIPLFNFNTIYHYLINSSLSFLSSFDDPRKPGRGRYNPKMYPMINITNWRKGSQWFELHRDLAIKLVSDTTYYPIFQKLCLPPCYMDEHYIPTLVHMKYDEMNSKRSITWVDWSRGGPHPGRFGWGDITDEFLNRIRFGGKCVYNGNVTNVCFLFARKFLPNALEPLLRVAPLLLGFDP